MLEVYGTNKQHSSEFGKTDRTSPLYGHIYGNIYYSKKHVLI